MNGSDSIEEYLDDLARRLTGPGETTRRFLVEVESHLKDSRDGHLSDGLEPREAQDAAIREFGTTTQVAQAHNSAAWRSSRSQMISETFGLLLRLSAVGMIVIGVAGGITRIIASFGLTAAMYGLPANVVMPARLCAHWLAVEPAALNCQQAGTLEASYDLTVVYFAIGVVGLMLGIPAVWVWLRNRKTRKALPPTLGLAISAAMFGAASVGLSALGASNAVISTTWGAGMWLTDATVALLACLVSVALLLRTIRSAYLKPGVPGRSEHELRR